MRTLVAALLAITLPGGCGGDSTQRSSLDSDEPLISFTRAGGVAGYAYGIEIRADGTGTVEYAGPDQSTSELEVSDERLAELVEHLESFDITSLDQGHSDGCADCFAYSLSFADETATADSSTVTEQFLDAADPVEALLRRHLPPSAHY